MLVRPTRDLIGASEAEARTVPDGGVAPEPCLDMDYFALFSWQFGTAPLVGLAAYSLATRCGIPTLAANSLIV